MGENTIQVQAMDVEQPGMTYELAQQTANHIQNVDGPTQQAIDAAVGIGQRMQVPESRRVLNPGQDLSAHLTVTIDDQNKEENIMANTVQQTQAQAPAAAQDAQLQQAIGQMSNEQLMAILQQQGIPQMTPQQQQQLQKLGDKGDSQGILDYVKEHWPAMAIGSALAIVAYYVKTRFFDDAEMDGMSDAALAFFED